MNKSRKKLTDTLAEEFVYAKAEVKTKVLDSQETKEIEVIAPTLLPVEKSTHKEKSILSKMLETETKEATIRFTVDMSESMHRKLSIFAARTGKKKAEIVRFLIEEALSEVGD